MGAPQTRGTVATAAADKQLRAAWEGSGRRLTTPILNCTYWTHLIIGVCFYGAIGIWAEPMRHYLLGAEEGYEIGCGLILLVGCLAIHAGKALPPPGRTFRWPAGIWRWVG